MRLAIMQAQRKALIAATLALTMLTILLAAPRPASAGSWGGTLNGHEWGSSGDVENIGFIYGKHEEGSSTGLCVGPVTHDSGGYHFPYGWDCGSGTVEWEFTRLVAAGAVYNNSALWLRYGALQE